MTDPFFLWKKSFLWPTTSKVSFQLRLLAKVGCYLSPTDCEQVIPAFITSRLENSISLYVGVDQLLLHRLQLLQNSAVLSFLTGARKRNISLVLASLHWRAF